MEWIRAGWDSLALSALSVLGIYAALVALTRIGGLRSFSKISGFDFAVTVAIGSMIATTVVTPDPPLMRSAFALACLFALQIFVAELRFRSDAIERVVGNQPRVVMIGDEFIEENMRAAKITRFDLIGKLREANVIDFRQIEAVIAETTGDVSVLHRSLDGPRLDAALLEGVIGADRFKERRAAER